MKIKHILLFLMAWVSSMSLAYAQQTVVASGSVMDEKGELLIGVSISVKEVPSMGAITDIDGRFKIGGIKAGHTLVISYVGYDPQEIKMNKSNERMRVVLKESSNVMDEVVITASGKVQKKINVTGAITGVEVATLKTPATSISNMLGGRVPGIISVTRSGEPGKDFSEFWVRGIMTVVANIILAPIFIFHFEWGMRGAATATVISQLIGMVWVVSHFVKKDSTVHFEGNIWKMNRRIVESISRGRRCR